MERKQNTAEYTSANLEKVLKRQNGSMGYDQYLCCHKGYEIDGTKFKAGDICRNASIRPVMNTDNWRPATVKEITEYFKRLGI